MKLVEIRKPVWHNRTISIRRTIVEKAAKDFQTLKVKIEARPYNEDTYLIDPRKALSMGKPWFIRGTELVNFPIKSMEVI